MAEGTTAGRALDARIAEVVMGWKDVKIQPIANAYGQHVIDDYLGRATIATLQPTLVPRYSTMLQDAWQVVERLRHESAFVAVISGKGPAGPQPWVCKINREGGFLEDKADTAPLAICLAALGAAGEIP
jgi:hypothetical protein